MKPSLLFFIALLTLSTAYAQKNAITDQRAAKAVTYFNAGNTDSLYTLFADVTKPKLSLAMLDGAVKQVKNALGNLVTSEYFTSKQGVITYIATFKRPETVLYIDFDNTNKIVSFYTDPDKREHVRPQDPTVFPYKQEDVLINNPGSTIQLAGTLTVPSNGKVSKIVIMITGSGPQNRNEELDGHRPFLIWSDWLTRNGIAVLRYDDRGVGKSTGNFSAATTFDFANDAEAAVSFIRSRPDLNKLSIGLVGHSEGGMIAPIVASRNKDVKFIVLLAGPGIPIEQLMLQQIADIGHVAGATDAAVNQTVSLNKKIYDLIIQDSVLPAQQLKNRMDTVLYHEMLNQHADMSKFNEAAQQYAGMLTPWYRAFLKINPADYLIKVKCPVLALDGTKDMQVNSRSNLAGISTALDKAGNKQYKAVSLDGLNHLFQKANTGNTTEYSQISETVNPIALTTVADWINTLSF